jgi:hypothetical protein
MSTDRWRQLSDWHNAWLAGDAGERQRLRDSLRSKSPELVAEADALIARNDSMAGFLETPAFVIAAARMAGDEAGLAPGTLVGPYRIASLIARGGMGLVYRATDTRLDRQVALKTLLRIGAPDDLGVERFLREARITASLDHPNIVKVFDVGMHDGQPFMVVELLEGETLRQTLDRGALKEPEARRIGIEVARGLVAAAAAGLVHRDLKPENIFLTRAGVTKVLDFGIAKLAPEAARHRTGASTLTGILLGTAGYLAPEQIQGAEADGRSDLFALGSILFEMLTGQRAFGVRTLRTRCTRFFTSLRRSDAYGADVSASLRPSRRGCSKGAGKSIPDGCGSGVGPRTGHRRCRSRRAARGTTASRPAHTDPRALAGGGHRGAIPGSWRVVDRPTIAWRGGPRRHAIQLDLARRHRTMVRTRCVAGRPSRRLGWHPEGPTRAGVRARSFGRRRHAACRNRRCAPAVLVAGRQGDRVFRARQTAEDSGCRGPSGSARGRA